MYCTVHCNCNSVYDEQIDLFDFSPDTFVSHDLHCQHSQEMFVKKTGFWSCAVFKLFLHILENHIFHQKSPFLMRGHIYKQYNI